MIVYYNNVDVNINGSGILADSASISSENSVSPVYVIGQKGIRNQVPEGPQKSDIQLNYYVQLHNEPNYQQSNTIKNLTGSYNWSGVQIVIGGITGYNCYLNSYSFAAAPNETIKAAASFSTFEPLSGNLSNTRTGIYSLSGLAHSWSLYVASTGEYRSVPTFEFNYNFGAEWEPIYKLGKKTPIQVNLNGGNEQFSFVRESFKHILFSGESANNFINNNTTDKDIDLRNIAFSTCDAPTTGTPALTFNFESGVIKTSQLNVSVGDFAKTTISVEKYF